MPTRAIITAGIALADISQTIYYFVSSYKATVNRLAITTVRQPQKNNAGEAGFDGE